MHNSLETKAIQQRMEEVRRDLDEDVQEIVEEARDMGKWRTYVRTYPWVCLGAAVAAGYLIVRQRPLWTQKSVAQMQVASALRSQLHATSNLPSKGNSRGILRALVGNLVMRGVTSYVGQHASKLFATPITKSQRDDQR